MKTVSKEFRQKMYDGAKFYQEAKILFADGREKELGKQDFYISGNTYSDGPGTNAFPLGEAMAKHITMSLVNDDDRFSDYDFYMAKITVWLKCDLSETTESILLGTYTVTTPETYGTSVIVEALDDMHKGDEAYDTELLYPATLGMILRDSCARVGVSLLSNTFSNDSFEIINKPENITHRQLWGMIAMLAGGNARMDENNYLKIVEYDFSFFDSAELEEEELEALENVHYFKRIKTPTIATDDVVITGVQTTVGEIKHIFGEEGYVLRLENQLLEEAPDEALKLIGNKIVGLQFRPFTIDHVAYPLAEFGDICYVKDRKGNIYQSVVTDVNFTYFSYTTITCAADDPIRNSSKYNSPTAEAIRRARKETKIQISEYDLAVQQLTNLITNSFGVFKTEKVQEDGSIVHYMHNKPELELSSVIWKMTANTFSVSSDGGKSWNAGLDSEGNAVVNVLNAIGINADWILTGILADRAGKSFWNMETGEAVFGKGTKLDGKSVDDIIEATTKAEQAIISVRVEYALGNSTGTAPNDGWSDEAPQWEDGKYMWQRTTTEYVDGTTETTSPTCISGATGQPGADGSPGTNGEDGADGVGVSSIQQYYLATANSSGVTTSTAGWTTGVQAITATKKYLWNYEEITYTDNTKTKTTPCIIGAYGDTGAQGEQGEKGDTGEKGATGADGKDGADGTRGTGTYKVTTAPSSYTTATGDFTPTYRIALSSVKTQSKATEILVGDILEYSYYHYPVGYVDSSYVYLGSRTSIRGATGATGVQGEQGDKGDTGNGISSIAEKYAVSTSSSTAPTSWSDTVPTMTATKKYLWNYEIITYTNGNEVETTKRVIGVYGDKGSTGEDGKDGTRGTGIYKINTAPLYIMVGSTNNDEKAYGYMIELSTVLSETGATEILVGDILEYDGYHYPVTSVNTNVVMDKKISIRGKGIESIEEQYYLSSSNTTQTGGSWSSTCPAWVNGYYIWTRSYITWTDGTTSTTTPVLANGINTANDNAYTANFNSENALNRVSNRYATCATAAATVAKTATLTDFSLYKGATVSVLFTYANTAANPTLNVNGTGAKKIRVNGANITKKFYWRAKNTVSFTYDGTYWVMSDTCANSILADWCDDNDVTLIDGGKLATHSVTANKIQVDDLIAFEATIGGWEITEDGLTKIGSAFILPTEEDLDTLAKAIIQSVTLTDAQKTAFDINCSGNINGTDLIAWKAILLGKYTLDDYPNYTPIKSDIYIDINPNDADKTIRLFGTNSFGSEVESYYGINLLKTQSVIAAAGRFGRIQAGEIVTDAGVNVDELNSKLFNTEIFQTGTFNVWYPNTSGLNIGWGIPTEYGGYDGCFHIQMGWIAIQFRVTAGNSIFARMRYGDNGWSTWKQIY